MKITWLGQGGLLLENESVRIMVDPYATDSVGEKDSSKHRKYPFDEAFLDTDPDFILITHEHLDHLDPATVEALLKRATKPVTFLAPDNAYRRLREFGGEHNYVMLNPHSVWSESGLTFYAVHAEHSDRTAVGFIIDDGERTFYISGDTLYNYDVIDEVLELVEDGVDYAFLPINGKGNNMNAKDAADFAYEIDAKCAIPLHYGLFDDLTPEAFDFDEVKVLEPFKTVEL